jgi:hypothetical protein
VTTEPSPSPTAARPGGRDRPRWASRLVVGPVYAVALLVVTAVLQGRDDVTRQAWVNWTSTSVDNLLDHPVQALVASAFVIGSGRPYAWAVLAVVGLVALAWRLGAWRTLAVVVTAHVLGTLISEGIIAWRVHRGVLPEASRHLVDVGPSYLVVAALVGAVAAGPWLSRLVGAAGFAVLAPSLFSGLAELDVSAVGHACAVVLGAGLAAALLPRRPEPAPVPPVPPPVRPPVAP